MWGGAKKDLFPRNHRRTFAHINLFINLSHKSGEREKERASGSRALNKINVLPPPPPPPLSRLRTLPFYFF